MRARARPGAQARACEVWLWKSGRFRGGDARAGDNVRSAMTQAGATGHPERALIAGGSGGDNSRYSEAEWLEIVAKLCGEAGQ